MYKLFRKFMWKLGRRMYMYARAEPRTNLPNDSGEVYVQKSIINAAPQNQNLIIFDVGANVGQWTLQLLSILDKSNSTREKTQVFSFEPVPKTREQFELSLKDQPSAQSVSVQTIALSSEIGVFEMVIWEDLAGTNSLTFDAKDLDKAQSTISVNTETIDHFCEANGITHINLLKCDAEGHDFRVLLGAKEMLAKGMIDVVQIEYNHRWIADRRYLKDVFDLIDGTDYILVHILADVLEHIDSWHPELERFFESNYAIIHHRAEKWFNIYHGKFDRSNVYS